MSNPVITHKYTAVPTVLQHNGTLYLYTGRDEAPPGSYKYIMNEWLCFSSNDLTQWKEHAVPLKATDFKWAKGDAYASKVIYRNGKFYWYAAVSHAQTKGKAIAVAMSDSPTGPFSDARGSALISNEFTLREGSDNFDPTVIIDDDEQAYIFWGKASCYYAKLKRNMIELDGPAETVALPGFEEGAHIHKRG